MHNKFKIDEMVIVNGIGKENGTIYKNRIAKVICRDPFYFDYNIKLENLRMNLKQIYSMLHQLLVEMQKEKLTFYMQLFGDF